LIAFNAENVLMRRFGNEQINGLIDLIELTKPHNSQCYSCDVFYEVNYFL